MRHSLRAGLFSLVVLLFAINGSAQDSVAEKADNRGQYPWLLANSYLGIHPGYIQYPFTNDLLKPGYRASSIVNPGIALRIVLGHEFNKYLSAQISYMRPILWLEYRDINGDKGEHAIFTNVGGLTVKGTLPVYKNLSVYGEGGLSVVTRAGFKMNDTEVVSSTNYAGYQFGGGLRLTTGKRWDILAGITYVSGKEDVKQPYTMFFGGGFTYYMRPYSAEKIKFNNSGGYIFHRNLLQVGVSTNALGYGLNYWFTKRPIPIFWDGTVRISRAINLQYHRNTFHGRRFFSLDWGANLSVLQTELNKETFFAASIFPMFKFYPLRTKPFDLYFNYVLAGPTYLSQVTLDGYNTGEHFTFYDAMGMGVYAGKNRNLNAEIRIAHYSNGNLFFRNPGVLIPFTFNLGYAF